MTPWARAGFLGVACLLGSAVSLAVDCGEADCGPHGECDPAGIAARCRCDDGFVSVSTYISSRVNLGAFCVPVGALPSVELCRVNSCGPHGVCVVKEGAKGPVAECVCDLGFAATEELSCEDDETDASEEACEGVACGEDSTCMAVADGLTCRCASSGAVVLGARKGEDLLEKFGPACSFPLTREEACGPDACGPKGTCVLGQAVLCDCESGFEELRRTASDGKRRGYCLPEGSRDDPMAPAPPDYTVRDEADGGVSVPLPIDGGGPVLADAGTTRRQKKASGEGEATQPSGGGCSFVFGALRGTGPGAWLVFAYSLLARRRREPLS